MFVQPRKKVAILNLHYSHNYGAVLQAAALQYFLKDNNMDPENINFIPRPKPTSFIRRNIWIFKNRFKKYVKHILRYNNAFDRFCKTWLKVSGEIFYNLADLEHAYLNYDVYIVGSDQVWRPKYMKDIAKAYFFSFVSTNCKKVAYAASFGVDEWEFVDDQMYTENIKNLIQNFKAISVREDSGVDICRDVFNVGAVHVLDPVLLVGKDFFDKVISKANISKQSSNIFYYRLAHEDAFADVLSRLGKSFNADVENVFIKSQFINKLFCNEYMEVPLWIAKIRDSKLVVTDSFHCCCFAIIYHKPFIFVKSNDRGQARLDSLFRMLDIPDVTLRNISDLDRIINKAQSIDYNVIENILNGLRIKSKEYLLNACI